MIKLLLSLFITLSIGGAGVSFIAEASKPGDFLYPVKTEVNERVRAWFVTDYVAKVNYQVDLVNERLSEIDALVAEGKLTPELAVKAKAEVLAQVEAVNQSVNAAGGLTAEEKNQLSFTVSRLKEALLKYQASLSELDKKAKNSSGGGSNTSTTVIVGESLLDLATQADVNIESELGDLESELADDSDMESETSADTETTNQDDDVSDNSSDTEEGETMESEDTDDTSASGTVEVGVEAEGNIEVQ